MIKNEYILINFINKTEKNEKYWDYRESTKSNLKSYLLCLSECVKFDAFDYLIEIGNRNGKPLINIYNWIKIIKSPTHLLASLFICIKWQMNWN